MLRYYRLQRNERAFKDFTGITVNEFNLLYERFEAVWLESERRRLERPDRQRTFGGGRSYRLTDRDQLLMVLVWLRLYPTTSTLGYLFDISQPSASRNSRRVLKVLHEITKDDFNWPDPPQKGAGRRLSELQAAYPDTFAIIDATEQPVERPQDKDKEKTYFSGKRRGPTAKSSIIVNEYGVIRAVANSVPGRTHDLTHIRLSGCLVDIPVETTVLADAGYDGLYKDLPEHSVATAHKTQRNHPLKPDHKRMNREHSSVRVIIENVFCHLKNFRSLTYRFRHDVPEVHTAAFTVIAALINRRTIRRLGENYSC